MCGISAPTDSAMAKNKSISNYKKFNSAIKKMCAKNKYVYIPTADILQKHPELYATFEGEPSAQQVEEMTKIINELFEQRMKKHNL